MKKYAFLFLFFAKVLYAQPLKLHAVELGVNTNCRGLSVVNDSIAWISGSNGWVGVSTNGGKDWKMNRVKNFETKDFRSLYAFNPTTAIIANAGAPANILITHDAGLNWEIVYSNNDTNAFFDGIDFWNEKEGMIYGDPIGGHLLLLHTKDGGLHWEELPQASRPELNAGEASFAASGTGIRCIGSKKIIIATGGKVSALLISSNKGKKWKRQSTPIIQGFNSTGIFSFTFFGKNKGVIVGGDYLADSMKTNHVFYTTNGGKYWLHPMIPTGGYRECVEYIGDETLLAVGPSGIDISVNDGLVWLPISEEKNYHVIRKARKGKLIIAAGKGKVSVFN